VDKQEQGTTQAVPQTTQESAPRSLAISERGIRTGCDFANMMSALISDIIAGRVTPQVGNAACNAGGKLLKIVEMQHQYGTPREGGGKEIVLANNLKVVGE
jgi:hypothetical protein